jgi:hypothetical protein
MFMTFSPKERTTGKRNQHKLRSEICFQMMKELQKPLRSLRPFD